LNSVSWWLLSPHLAAESGVFEYLQ
jgi:hypothetical protein